MKSRIFSLAIGLILTAHAEPESLVSEDVYLRIDECIHDYYYPFVKSSDMPEAKALREKAFAGLDDREKIRALAEWMFRFPPPTHSEIPSNTGKLLIAPNSVIRDYSELHRLMAVETDSRRFYQLSVLASAFGDKNGDNFLSDCARGLFMTGVAADRGQSTSGYPLDRISSYSFSRITQKLRDENPKFKEEVYPELIKLDFEERPLALAKWLKENRPGCESLEIPSDSSSQPTKPLATDPHEKSLSPGAARTNPALTKEERQPRGAMVPILIGSFLLAGATCWYFFRR